MTKPRLAIVASHVIQHFAPVYRQLEESGAIDLRVFFIAENGAKSYRDSGFDTEVKWDVDLTSGYPHEFVEPGKVIRKFGFFSIDSKNIVPAVNRFSPDIIWLHGYASLANWRIVLDRNEKTIFIYGSDSNPRDSRSKLLQWIKLPIVKFFLRRCHHFLSISPANKQYLRAYGVEDSAITDSKFPVDICRLKAQRDQLSKDQVDTLRNELEIPLGGPVVTFAGKLIAHKRPQDVIEVLLEPGLDAVHAVLLGSGEMWNELHALANNLNIRDRVHFAGFINQSQLAKYFELADILVFPSAREPYGAIAAETLPFGLPIVASDVVGAIGASILPDANALLYAAGDVSAMGKQLRRIVEDDELRQEFSRKSLELADEHDKCVMSRDIIDICLQM